jgi:NAD(P)-dependent dehydrogenase (short-subunit alcohol dehydrogenase family)
VSTDVADAGASGALAGRVILVSGAHGGLGRPAALACARAGATVVLLGRKVPKLNRVYDAIRNDAGGLPEPLNYPMDLSGATPADMAGMAGRIASTLGRLDGILHCAADFDGLTPLEHTDPALFARALHVGLTARWWMTQACLPLLRQAADASIVFVLDDAPESVAYRGGYGVAQAAQAGLVAMLGAELRASAVRVSGLRPGPMRTPLRSKAFVEDADRRAAAPESYAAACVALLSAAGAAHRGTVWAPG